MTLENNKDGAPDVSSSSSDINISIDAVAENFTNMAVLDDNSTATLSVCANCGKSKGETEKDKLKNCSACKLVKYCSAACQKEHRPTHKKECKQRAAELREEKLFKDHPPTEDCPICLVPLPFDETLPNCFILCCGIMICAGCNYGMFKDRGSKQQLCAYCRVPSPNTGEERVRRLKILMDKGNSRAFNHLGGYYDRGIMGMPRDHQKAHEFYLKAGELGCSQAYYNLGVSYDQGYGVEMNKKKAKHYYELAVIGGDVHARYNLGCYEKQSGNFDRAFKHFVLAARAGCKKSLDVVKLGFRIGLVTKDEYASTLRAHQKSIGDMKSDMRDEAASKTNLNEEGQYGRG